MFDLGIDPLRPAVTAHNALEDARNQAICIQNVCTTLQTYGVNPFSKVK